MAAGMDGWTHASGTVSGGSVAVLQGGGVKSAVDSWYEKHKYIPYNKDKGRANTKQTQALALVKPVSCRKHRRLVEANLEHRNQFVH